jgi:hypothetical protein
MKAKKYLYIPLWWPDLSIDWQSWLPNKGNFIFTLFVLGSVLWGQSVGAISLGAPLTAVTSTVGIPYQGRLADKNGMPLTQTVNMVFRLYAAASGGAPLWEEQWIGANSVQVSDGLFNVMLGSLTPIPQTIITGNSNLFLGITVGTDSEMSPRVQLGSVPFATQALTVPDRSITKAKLATSLFRVQRASTTTNWQLPTCGGSTETNSSYTTIPGLSLNFNLSEPQTLLVNFTGTGGNSTAIGAIFTNIFVDGARSVTASGIADIGGCRNSSTDGSSAVCTLSNTAAIDLPAGTHTVDVRAMCEPNGLASIWSGSMWALMLP